MRRLTQRGKGLLVITVICALITSYFVYKKYFVQELQLQMTRIPEEFFMQPAPAEAEEDMEEPTLEEDSPAPDTVFIVPTWIDPIPEEQGSKVPSYTNIIDIMDAAADLASAISPMAVPLILYFTHRRMKGNLIENIELQ